jgi:hypothetical protein
MLSPSDAHLLTDFQVFTCPGALYPYHPRVALPVVLGIQGLGVGGFPSLL